MKIKDLVFETAEEYLDGADVLLVLKGVDIQQLYPDLVVDIDNLLEDRLQHFIGLKGTRQIITYDEYIALYEFVISQYQRVVIVENNLFMNHFPLQVKLSEQKLKDLEVHFDEDKQGDKYEISNLVDLTTIYGNVKRIKDNYYIIYNQTLEHEKEVRIKLFTDVPIKEFPIISSAEKSYDITDEEDYVRLLDDLINNNVRVLNVIGKETALSKDLFNKFCIIKELWEDVSFNIVSLKKARSAKPVRKEFYNILKTYWGKDSFRDLEVYDTQKLNSREKAIEKVSQSDVITDIVEEAEKCRAGKDYRDVFVTAPTGAGKSAMFQIPAIYLAEKHELFTIVISPLIGLMKDQVANLEINKYSAARTINSDISPVKKQEIINDISDKKCHILYLSPESLLSKSDLEQIIGDRTLGILIVDEAHIVTTWGKQFRPDYWYLGDHLNRMKKTQINKKGMGFVIATFTATAIYGGIENMYEETIESLRMIDPITYLGYVKRHDIEVNVCRTKNVSGRSEYELNKFDQLIEKIDYALTVDKKMLIYFPTVALISRFFDYCNLKGLDKYVSRYHGKLSGYEKEENYNKFLNKETPIMLATKAFGMGIDIDDIEIVAHFSPTGNVCDYVQEIGRAARRPGLKGEAFYKFMSSDFKHLNRLHGLSIIKEYQLVEVIRKVYELYQENIRSNQGGKFTKKRNEMLVDAETFAHVFENPFFSEDDGINKVKTAMLLIQKDFERAFSFSPFVVRPIPLFETGFFSIKSDIQKMIRQKYGPAVRVVEDSQDICSVNLKSIWEHGFNRHLSFPKFKY
ncbi:MAG TPA: DEAD/DEAH box helicase, partial [Chitinophagales bacterium]|nr:DEAD/DEAH box helicase [Chitinophagales bacterium]